MADNVGKQLCGKKRCRGQYEYDLIVIGSGIAGLTTAIESASLGAKVALFDYCHPSPRGNKWEMGGSAINVGALPVKLLRQAAVLGEELKDSQRYGWNFNEEDPIHNWKILVEAIQNQVSCTVASIKTSVDRLNIRHIKGNGSFVDAHTVKAATDQGEVQITAASIVIATGTRAKYPPVIGAKEYGITNEDILNLEKPPGKTLILGAGHNGMEYAGFLVQIGCDVTVVSRSNRVLRLFDKDMVDVVVEDMEKRGVRFLYNVQMKAICKCTCEGKLKVTYTVKDNCKLFFEEFDTVIFTCGRRVTTEDLNLERAGVELAKDDESIHTIDDRTNVPHIYAVGDVKYGRPQIAGFAAKAGRLLARRLFGDSTVNMDYKTFGFSVTTPLEYGIVGLTEDEALDRYGEDNIDVYHGFYSPFQNFVAPKVTKYCYLKVIAKRDGDQEIFGIHYTGPDAGVVVQGFVCAVRCGLTVSVLKETVPIHWSNAEEIIKLKITKRSGEDPTPQACCS